MEVSFKGRILIIEDDCDMAALLKSFLEYEGFRVDLAENIAQTERFVGRFSFDAVLLDLHLGEENGLSLLSFLIKSLPFAKIIVMTAFGSIDMAVDAMEKGATTFITKSGDPQKIVEELKSRLVQSTVGEGTIDTTKLATELGIVGVSPAIKSVLEQIDQIKDVDTTVLLLGESGTGKELVARAIHRMSQRRHKPFEAINCGAIPENLLEAELFGYRRGAFTDAKNDRKGMFEHCHEGTFFLDEIGELPLNLQVKLLRVIQEREVKPLGAPQSISINTRVICATNKNLSHEVSEGRFRDDLYFRLSVIPITLPALRDRREDIAPLVELFLSRYNLRYNRSIDLPSKESMARIIAYEWPGNIRELQNCIERAVVLAKGKVINIENIFFNTNLGQKKSNLSGGVEQSAVVYSEAKEHFEKSFLTKILSLSHGNVSEAARISGRFRSDIYRLMDKYGIHHDDFR